MVREKKALPVIVLGNKMDLCDESELQHLLQEKTKLLTDIFGGVVTAEASSLPPMNGKLPVLIPTSLRYACFYRKASFMPMKELKEDLALPEATTCLNKLGYTEHGRRNWDALSEDEKIKEAYGTLNNPKRLQGLLESTNFDKFGPVLAKLVNSSEVLTNKIKYLLCSMTFDSGRMIEQMHTVNAHLDELKQPKDSLIERYWALFNEEVGFRVKHFCSTMDVSCLEALMEELALYHGFSNRLGWNQELQQIDDKMKSLLRCQFGILFKYSNCWTLTSWKKGLSSQQDIQSWKALSPLDWKRIFMSILLLQGDPVLLGNFSHEVVILQERAQAFQAHALSCSWPACTSTNCVDHPQLLFYNASTNLDGSSKNKDSSHRRVYTISQEHDIRKSGHWGHLVWMYCRYVNQRRN